MTQETETLWQIGKPGKRGQEFVQAGGWQAEFTYVVGSDEDGVEPGIASRPSLEEPDLRFSPHPATGY